MKRKKQILTILFHADLTNFVIKLFVLFYMLNFTFEQPTAATLAHPPLVPRWAPRPIYQAPRWNFNVKVGTILLVPPSSAVKGVRGAAMCLHVQVGISSFLSFFHFLLSIYAPTSNKQGTPVFRYRNISTASSNKNIITKSGLNKAVTYGSWGKRESDEKQMRVKRRRMEICVQGSRRFHQTRPTKDGFNAS